jgi:heme exporter protein A
MGEIRQENRATNAVISISGVSKAFSTRLVLKNIDLEVSSAHSVCLCGVNGVGKSTLLRIITGLLQPDKGVIRICGYNVGRDPEKAKPQLGVISHKSMVYPNLTAIENLSFFANLYGVKDSTARIDKLLHDVGLFSYRFDRAGTLSRGLLHRAYYWQMNPLPVWTAKHVNILFQFYLILSGTMGQY